MTICLRCGPQPAGRTNGACSSCGGPLGADPVGAEEGPRSRLRPAHQTKTLGGLSPRAPETRSLPDLEPRGPDKRTTLKGVGASAGEEEAEEAEEAPASPKALESKGFASVQSRRGTFAMAASAQLPALSPRPVVAHRDTDHGLGRDQLRGPRPEEPIELPSPAALPRIDTKQGVAAPGIAPLRPGSPSAAERRRARRPSAPPPSPVPAPAAVSVRPAAPRSAVALITASGLLLGSAVAFALLWRGHARLTAELRVGEGGVEQLQLACPSCPDGTEIALAGSDGTLREHRVQLALHPPLPVGSQKVVVDVREPGHDAEQVAVELPPVEYRITASPRALQAAQPSMMLDVEALPGSVVEIGGQLVALDELGRGEHRIDLTAFVTGQEATLVNLDRSVPYEVTPPTSPSHAGELRYQVGVTPLHLEAPGLMTIVGGDRFMLSGRTSPGASVWVAGSAIEVDADGYFAQLMSIDSTGETEVELRASSPAMAPRLTSFRVRRVQDVEREYALLSARAIPFERATREPTKYQGALVSVEGTVSGVKAVGHAAVLLVTPSTGCEPSPCLVRLTHSGLERPAQGARVRAVGRLRRILEATAQAGPVPEIEVSLLL